MRIVQLCRGIQNIEQCIYHNGTPYCKPGDKRHSLSLQHIKLYAIILPYEQCIQSLAITMQIEGLLYIEGITVHVVETHGIIYILDDIILASLFLVYRERLLHRSMDTRALLPRGCAAPGPLIREPFIPTDSRNPATPQTSAAYWTHHAVHRYYAWYECQVISTDSHILTNFATSGG